jgi:hypothetical protein
VNTKVTPGEIVVMAGGAVALIFSFLPFYSLDLGPLGEDDISAWGSGLFPVATFIVFFAVIAALLVVLTKFANMRITGFLGFGFNQLLLAASFFSAILALGYLIQDNSGYDFGFGYYLVLLGAIATLVGSILIVNERRGAGTI